MNRLNKSNLRLIVILLFLLPVISNGVPITEARADLDLPASLLYASGKWEIASTPTSNDLHSVSMTSADEAWAVGARGTILHYAGGSWQQVASPTDRWLYSVDMLSVDEGWAVGEGTILHYLNGTWQQVNSPTKRTLYSVDMVSVDEGWAVGEGTILHCQRGSWLEVPSPTDGTLRSISMGPAGEGWAVGYGKAPSYEGLLLLNNFGTWEVKYRSGQFLHSVSMASATEAWAVGYGTMPMQHYSSGSWHVVSSPVSNHLYAVDMISPEEGWAVGDTGIVIQYSGGIWQFAANLVPYDLLGLDIHPQGEGWAVGKNGTILHYQGTPSTNESDTDSPGPGDLVLVSVSLTPERPLVNSPVRVSCILENFAYEDIPIEALGMGLHGPDACAYENPWDAPIPFNPGSLENMVAPARARSTFTMDLNSSSGFSQAGTYMIEPLYKFGDRWLPFAKSSPLWFDIADASGKVPEPPCLMVQHPLLISPNPAPPGADITAQFTVRNNSPRTITLDRLLAAGRRGEDWTSKENADFPDAVPGSITLAPGESYEYRQNRTFDQVGEYFAEPWRQESGTAGRWYTGGIRGGERVAFSISSDSSLIEKPEAPVFTFPPMDLPPGGTFGREIAGTSPPGALIHVFHHMEGEATTSEDPYGQKVETTHAGPDGVWIIYDVPLLPGEDIFVAVSEVDGVLSDPSEQLHIRPPVVHLFGAYYKPFFIFDEIDTRGEAEQTGAMLEIIGYESQVHIDTDSSQAYFSLPQASVFYFSGHASNNSLVFENAASESSYLGSKHVAMLDLDTIRLAVLNGCKTGKNTQASDSIMRAFLNQGAETVIGFRSSVPSTIAQAWNTAFWQYALFQDYSVGDAARQAAIDVDYLEWPNWDELLIDIDPDTVVILGNDDLHVTLDE